MKKTFFYAIMAVMLLCSFSLKNLFGQSTTTTEKTETTVVNTNADGVNAGKALRSLYTNYQKAGKFDYTNLSNIINTVSLINSCKNLKTNISDKTYWSSFAQGLVNGTENLVTEDISDQVTSQLNNIVSSIDTEKLETAAQQASAVNSISSELSSLLASFK